MPSANTNRGKAEMERRWNTVEEMRENGDIPESDGDAILEFAEYDMGKVSENTVRNHLDALRLSSKRSDVPLVEMESAEELNDLLRSFQTGTHPGVKEGGIIVKNYVSAFRKFYRWFDCPVDDSLIDIESDYSGRDLTADDLLYEDEVDALLAAANRASIRDMALIALTLATGQRVDAVRTLRLGDIRSDGPTMEVKLNTEDGNLKGASGSKPLLWAKHYVRPWYENHPHKDDLDAALFPPEELGNNFREHEKYATRPISQNQFRKALKKRAREAGIEKRLYPHLLRHSAMTRMVAEGLSEQQIKQLAGWHGDSSQFETYVHLADEIATDSVRESLGVPTSETGRPAIGRPSLDSCPTCNDKIPDDVDRCPTCSTPLTHDADPVDESEKDEADEKIRESYRSAESMDKVEKLQMLDDLLDDPEVRELIDERDG